MKKVEILGPGCPNCKKLEANTKQAAEELGLECEIEKVSDIKAIMGYGVMMTPALVVDGEVKISGKVATVSEIKAALL